MRCAMRACAKTKDVNPNNQLCPSCEKTIFGSQRRVDHHVRQNNARAQVHDQQRNLNVSLSPPPSTSTNSSVPMPGPSPDYTQPSMAPPAKNLMNFPTMTTATTHTTNPSTPAPSMDIPNLQNSYNEMVSSGSQPKILTDMFGMMLNVLSKQNENDKVIEEVKSNVNRIRELEAKVGGPDQISEKLGLAIRNLPMPPPGVSELSNFRD